MAQTVVAYLETAQTSANAYAVVTGTVLELGDGDNVVRMMLEETGTNDVTAKLVGRHHARPTPSAWTDVSAEAAITSGSSATFTAGPDLGFDEYAIQVKSTVADTHGTVRAYGSASRVDSYPASSDTSALSVATRVVNAESADVINVDYALNVGSDALLFVQGYAVPTAAGDLVEAGAAALTIATGTNGTDVLPAGNDDQLLFTTTATGIFELDFTDVVGASAATFIAVLREGGPTGRVLDVHAVTFD